jgi:hypothetical protein
MLISIEYKTQAAGSNYINSYSIRKMTRFALCGLKRVSGPFSSAGFKKKMFSIYFLPESKGNI